METIAGRFVVDKTWNAYVGEMSQVVKAVDTHNGMQFVAVKLFDKHAFEQPPVAEAFSRECESLQRLNTHDNIVKLIDLGRDDATGARYIALEWCESNLLAHLKGTGPISWDAFYQRYGKPVLDALRFAYSQGILHRDVKPQNVLVTADGKVRVTDFGIAKFKRYDKPGVTLAHFKSKPYAPEEDPLESGETRDVFSYAVLCLECVTGSDFNTYEDVYAALEQADIPPAIQGIFSTALEKRPADRQPNIVLFAEEIDTAVTKAAALAEITHSVPISISHTAASAMKAEARLETEGLAHRAILDALNETYAFDELADKQNEGSHIAILTAEFSLRAVIDWKTKKLAIIGLSRQSPSWLERKRDQAWQPLVRFTEGASPGDQDELDWFAAELGGFLTNRKVEKEKLAENELFDRWSAILRFKEGLQRRSAEDVHFDSATAEGTRLRLGVRHEVSDDIVGQNRLIRLSDNTTIGGEVERTGGGEIVLYCGSGQNLDSAPQHGTLAFDDRLAQTAIRRQLSALDAVKFGRSVRTDFRSLLTGKIKPKAPIASKVSFIQQDLDEDKQAGIAAALGTPDLLIVEGPPGTGKTKFITELVAQALQAPGSKRVLISSQTHVALDHALANIENLAKQKSIPLRAVRIARPNDERVSPGVGHLLLEKSVRSWLGEAEKRSEDFLIQWAGSRGISPQDVRIGVALGDLRQAKSRKEDLETSIRLVKEELEDLTGKKKALTKERINGDEYRGLSTDIRLKTAELDDIEERLVIARRRHTAATERARSFPELDGQIEGLSLDDMLELEQAFVSHADEAPRFRKMLALAEEWRQRFGQSSDFHGAYVSDCDLVGGTCLGVATHALQTVEFDLCIVDEASKAAPTEILVPMAKSKKWVVVGDPNQLPPFADESRQARLELERQDLGLDDIRRTLLDHLIATVPSENKVSLTTQHRMTKAIGDLVSHCFYQGRLNNVNTKRCEWLAKAFALPKPVTWLNTASLTNRFEFRHHGTFVNPCEIDAISNLLLRLELAASKRKNPYSIALLSGYGGQVAALERLVDSKRKQLANLSIETGTVDSYQGREADIAVYSVTRCNDERKIGFLREHERLNVALSRAKLGLAIVGDVSFCRSVDGQNPFGDVISYMNQHPDDCHFEELVS